MGLTLGLIGGGGSILTVPILVYLFAVDPLTATAYSLFIVGITSLIGSFSHYKQGNIHWKTALIFGVPSIAGVYLSRAVLVPLIPAQIASLGFIELTKPLFILLLFSVLMIFASISMIRKSKVTSDAGAVSYNYKLIFLEGIVVGLLTGLVGAGGGFLIIPALVLFANLPMKQAVGTSLIIIAVKSLIGFSSDLQTDMDIRWDLLVGISVISIIGIFIGSYLTKFISNEKLKPVFGYFVLIMGLYIITKELFFN
jgi:uncharacterized protein